MYTEEIIAEVWQKADVVPDNDAGMWRKDACGAWIQRSRYGDRSSDYGWEIDLIRPAGSTVPGVRGNGAATGGTTTTT